MIMEQPEGVVAKGIHAEHLLNDEVLQEAFRNARETFRKQWLDSDDREVQYAAWAGSHAVSAVEKELRRIISTGQHAQAQLARGK